MVPRCSIGRRADRWARAAALASVVLAGCQPGSAPERPSVLLVVIDTLRADAVSAYGAVRGTTPNVDALAAQGLRYTHAYAPAPWTIPSHVSLFTGLGVEHHHVGMSEHITAGPELVMLAERLRDAGYDTAGFAENPLIGEPFGMNQGFEHFAARTLAQLLADFSQPGSSGYDVIGAVESWARARDPHRPFFVFVNLFEPHEPYRVRELNPFLPPGTTAAEAAGVRQSPSRICDAIPSSEELAILRGLYLGDVAAADATLGEVVRRVRTAAGPHPLLIVVTADHGEHLGERRLLDHQFTVADVALHIPLVVTGLADAAPAVIDTPVSLIDVTASVLQWAGVDTGSALDGHPLPTAPGAGAEERDVLSAYTYQQPSDWPLDTLPGDTVDQKRAQCGQNDRVFGDMATLMRYPFKLVWYAQYSPQLYDLAHDPQEQTDLAPSRPALIAQLGAALADRITRSGLFVRAGDATIDPAAEEALRALGYRQ